MRTLATLSFIVIIIGLPISAYAGPCAGDIDKMQARIDAALQAKAAAGPTGKEAAFAGMSEQPTPGSISAAEERLGELSTKTVDAVRAAMESARAADTAGDKDRCESALAEAQRLIGR